MTAAPSLRFERGLLRDGVLHLACADEVGRGALCGPVTIGVVVITAETKSAPKGVRDSKLLAPEMREKLAPKIRRWAVSHAVGHASPAEIDEFGIIAALRLAGQRALSELSVVPDMVLLDGNHDYLTNPEQDALFGSPSVLEVVPPVVTKIKGDMTCAGVAAASILAKTARDALMLALAPEHPDYGWHENKGYAAPVHIDALSRLGPTVHHRRSWSLPGLESVLAEPTTLAP